MVGVVDGKLLVVDFADGTKVDIVEVIDGSDDGITDL